MKATKVSRIAAGALSALLLSGTLFACSKEPDEASSAVSETSQSAGAIFTEHLGERDLGGYTLRILATAPDLICLVDTETFIPVTTDGLKYGKRVLVVGLKCYPMWRTPKGIELVGPRYFGIDADYIPVEERVKGGAANV